MTRDRTSRLLEPSKRKRADRIGLGVPLGWYNNNDSVFFSVLFLQTGAPTAHHKTKNKTVKTNFREHAHTHTHTPRHTHTHTHTAQ